MDLSKENARKKKWHEKNPDKVKANSKRFYEKNKDDPEYKAKSRARGEKYHVNNKDDPEYIAKYKVCGAKWYEKNKDDSEYKAKCNARSAKWHEKNPNYTSPCFVGNPDYANNWAKNRYKSDSNFRMSRVLRARLFKALNGTAKVVSTLKLLGCSVGELWKYFESMYVKGMSKDNHGSGPGKWHVDHIIACANFDLTDLEEQKKCFHYTNLQPLWEEDNRQKGSS